jgi:hypothetical protein
VKQKQILIRAIFWDVMPCSLVEFTVILELFYPQLTLLAAFLAYSFNHENGGNMFLQNPNELTLSQKTE